MPAEEATGRAARLGALLASRNAVIRREAAQALGHFPITNPQVSNLIRQYLQNGSWDTRVSAALALRIMLTAATKGCATRIHQKPATLRLHSLDIPALVQDYYPLLSCETELVSRMESYSEGERKQLMDAQRRLMDNALRLQPNLGVSCAPFVTQDDLFCGSEEEHSPVSKKAQKSLETSALVVKKEEAMCDELDIAIQELFTRLLNDLADCKWEVRHGATLAFDSIISAVPHRLSAEMMDLLATRLLQTLALDNFIDFASGRCAVGPVREGAAECIASMMENYPSRTFLDAIAQQLFSLYGLTEATTAFSKDVYTKRSWYQRQAALLVLKYHFAGSDYFLNFQQFYTLLTRAFDDPHDEVSSTALSAVTALFCKAGSLRPEVALLLADVELVIYRFIDSTCCTPRPQQLLDVDTVIVDLLTLLMMWMRSDETRSPPCSVLISLSRLLNPILPTRCMNLVNVFNMCFSRKLPLQTEESFDECCMRVLSSLLRVVLFASPHETDSLIEACISCVYSITRQMVFLNRLPSALVDTFGRWSACLMLDAKSAQIDVSKHNVGDDTEGNNPLELMCGEEIRTLPDMERIDALVTRKVHVARFLAPLLSAIHSFPSTIGDQSLSDATELLITPMLGSPAIMHRLGGSLLTHSWFSYNWTVQKQEKNPPIFLAAVLHRMVLSPSSAYEDERFFCQYMDTAYKEFITYCSRKGVKRNEIEHIENTDGSVDQFASEVFGICSARISRDEDRVALRSHYDNFNNVVSTAKAVMTLNVVRVNALLVSALITVHPQTVFESSTLNPFVKPFMELLRCEQNLTVLRHTFNSLPVLFRITSERKPSPHAKMLKQIVTNLTCCENRFPQDFESTKWEILSQRESGPVSVRSQNAEFAVRALVCPFACVDLSGLLDFRTFDTTKVMAMYMEALSVYFDEVRRVQSEVPTVALEVLPHLKTHLISRYSAMRLCAARCVSAIARLDGMLSDVLSIVIVPLRDNVRYGTAMESTRCGLVELVFFMSQLTVEMIGALRVIAPLALRLMTDFCDEVRDTAAIAFRTLVPLMTLKAARNGHQALCANDLADEFETDCSIDMLLGNPSQLTPLPANAFIALCPSVQLRPYQLEGIQWMSFLEQYGLSGILADDMGLGKTLQALCLLAMKIADNPHAKVLIVCPPTLVEHWCAEWRKYFPSLPPLHSVTEGNKQFHMTGKHTITVASYNALRSLCYFQEIDWLYVVLDEGHAIRNPSTRLFKAVITLRARNRLLLSGTPVQNTPADLWALFQFLMPGYLGTMKQFKLSFLNAINACRNANASQQQIQEGERALNTLHKAVLPFVLRRLKIDVVDDLPDKIVQDYPCTMSAVQRALYEHIIERCKRGTNCASSANSAVPSLSASSAVPGLSALETITELRKCIVHPILVSAKAAQGFNTDTMGVVGETTESGKMVALSELLRECGIGASEGYTTSEYTVQECELCPNDMHRALIFCQRLATVQLIADFFKLGLLGHKIRYSILDGSVPVHERHSIAENFNKDPGIDVLLLTTSVGGEGLNLTGADVVIFVEHDWNPVKDLQAMDRAHRLGQERTVNVYRLITENSLEQKIMRCQKFKTDTANALVGADNRSLHTMATEQLVDLFSTEGASTSSKTPRREPSSSSAGPEDKWNLEELWDQSQYDRFNVVNIAMEMDVRGLKRPSPDATTEHIDNKQLRFP